MSGESLLTALALVLLIEGVLPFVSPARWREFVTGLAALADGQIRFFGLIAIGIGVLLLLV